MIRYALICSEDHGFEAWFRDSTAFDEQNRDRLVDCPHCGSSEVRKALMAPAVRTARSRGASAPGETQAVTPEPSPGAVVEAPAAAADEPERRLRSLVRELHAKVRAEAQNVGPLFPQEARRIHDGDVAPRAIYGTATNEEARALVEDGVAIMPLPPLPDERN